MQKKIAEIKTVHDQIYSVKGGSRDCKEKEQREGMCSKVQIDQGTIPKTSHISLHSICKMLCINHSGMVLHSCKMLCISHSGMVLNSLWLLWLFHYLGIVLAS